MLELFRELASITSKGENAALATVITSKGSTPRKPGTKMLIKGDGTVIGSIGGGAVEKEVIDKAKEVMKSNNPQIMHYDLTGTGREAWMICGGKMDIFIEPIQSLETLFLFGAGHIANSTAVIAKMLGFQVVVIDPRADYNNEDNFPTADSLVVEEFENAFSTLPVDENSYIVIYTPGHVSDEKSLEFAINTSARYVGMIGSKKKVNEIKNRLLEKGISEQQIKRVHAPIGIDIAAETPEEIAISILAEIIKVRRTARS
jgi:xanthine dehydrogenase accessory factor